MQKGLKPLRTSHDLPLPELEGALEGPDALVLGEPLSIRQAAQTIGCSPWTIRNRLVPKGLPHFRMGKNGKMIFYRKQVVAWILHSQHQESRSQ